MTAPGKCMRAESPDMCKGDHMQCHFECYLKFNDNDCEEIHQSHWALTDDNHQPRSSHGEGRPLKSPTGQAHRSRFLHSGTVKINNVQISLRLSQTTVHRPVDVTVH